MSQILAPVDWLNATSLQQQLAAFFPKLLVAFVIIILGIILGNVVKNVLEKFLQKLRKLKFLTEAEKIERLNIINITAETVRIIIYIITIFSALYILGFSDMGVLVSNVVSYIPNLIISIILLIGGLIIGSYLSRALSFYLMRIQFFGLVEEKKLKSELRTLTETSIKGILYFIVILVVLQQLQIATDIFYLTYLAVLVLFISPVIFLSFFFLKDNINHIFAGVELRNENKNKAIFHKKKVKIKNIGIISTSIEDKKGIRIVPNKKFREEATLI